MRLRPIPIPAFLFGTFLEMVIAYLIDMNILGIPWEDKWHWFDLLWWKSRVLLIICFFVGGYFRNVQKSFLGSGFLRVRTTYVIKCITARLRFRFTNPLPVMHNND